MEGEPTPRNCPLSFVYIPWHVLSTLPLHTHTNNFFEIVFLCVCVCCLSEYMAHECAGTQRFQKRAVIPLKLELQEVLSCLTLVLGIELGFLAVRSAPNH